MDTFLTTKRTKWTEHGTKSTEPTTYTGYTGYRGHAGHKKYTESTEHRASFPLLKTCNSCFQFLDPLPPSSAHKIHKSAKPTKPMKSTKPTKPMKSTKVTKEKCIHIISDSTGETATAITRAALVHYSQEQMEARITRYNDIRNFQQIDAILQKANVEKDMFIYTIVDSKLRQHIRELCAEKNIFSVDLLGPLLNNLNRFLGTSLKDPQAGILRAIDQQYHKRIEAIEYTVKHDDGNLPQEWDEADIVLVGVSRSSKTPLAIFLGHKGWKVANIPLVLHSPLPRELFEIDQQKIIGLSIDVTKLQKIRRNRLHKIGQKSPKYANLEYLMEEMEYSEFLFKKNRKWPIIDVTDRALEETATEVTRIICKRLGLSGDLLL